MTCREFKDGAAELTLWELTRGQNAELLSHGKECEACGGWLQKQHMLALSMETLQARTAGLEAGPDVERALLRAFRQNTHEGVAARPQQDRMRDLSEAPAPGLSEVRKRSASLRPAVMPLSTPTAMRMSRVFEVGSYVALAAALLVGVFLGLRLLEHSSGSTAAVSQVTPAANETAAQSARSATPNNDAASPAPRAEAIPVKVPARRAVTQRTAAKASSDDAATLANSGYMDLMFCDPLSCAADTQVVRMELPATGQGSQPQMADLVVGYDGVVRAVRIVD